MNKYLAGLVFAVGVSGAHAAVLDFTIVTGGFEVASYTLVGGTSLAAGTIDANNDIAKEAGFASILLDVDGENLDVFIDDLGDGNPYFDDVSGGKPAGLGSCRVLTGSAQCDPNSDDNITITENEILSLAFRNDSGSAQLTSFGDFAFRDDNHNLITGNIQVSAGGTSYIIEVVGGIGDLSVIGAASELQFNAATGSDQNFYISAATVTAVPVPAAAWLFGSALIGLVAIKRRRV